MTDFRALCIELTDCLEKADWPLRYRYVFRQWVDIARAALADEPAVPDGREPASVTGQPSDEELLELWQGWNLGWDPQKGMVLMPHPAEYARAVLARWGHPAPPPADGEVAELVKELRRICFDVAPCDDDIITRAADLLERLSPPQPVPVSERLPGPEDCLDEGWAWFFSPRVGWRQAVFPVSTAYTHWLPAHALPIPHQQENAND